MQEKLVRFIVTDHQTEFDLIKEAWIKEKMVSELMRTQREWHVTFFADNGGEVELPWEVFREIYQEFTEFVQEMNRFKEKEHDIHSNE